MITTLEDIMANAQCTRQADGMFRASVTHEGLTLAGYGNDYEDATMWLEEQLEDVPSIPAQVLAEARSIVAENAEYYPCEGGITVTMSWGAGGFEGYCATREEGEDMLTLKVAGEIH